MITYSSWLCVIVLAAILRSCRGACGCGPVLEADVVALRAEAPAFLVKLGDPYPARQVLRGQKLHPGLDNTTCQDDGGSAGGPWRLKVDINVKKGPYKKEHRVILEIPPSYPAEVPAIRFGSKVISSYLMPVEGAHSSLPTHELRRALQERVDNRESSALSTILETLHSILLKPLDSSAKPSWSAQAHAFREEFEVERKYRKKRQHKELFFVQGITSKGFPDPVVAPLRQAIANISGMDRELALQSLLNSGIVSEVVPGLAYSFEVFSIAFCETLMEEIRNFYSTGLPAKRPNSMNKYGIILNDIGLEPLMFAIQDEVVQPLSAVLFPTEGSELESHHAFTIRYKGGEDTHLDVHTDDSDVTFNVNVFGDYEGCPLVFCGLVGAPDHRHFRTAYQHRLGHAVMHSGRHRHGAEDITKGERMNLVIWSYSYNFRSSAASKKKHKRESGPPDPRCVSYTHDRDFGRFKDFPLGKRQQFFGRGWCPQRGKEYKGFVPDVPPGREPRRQRHDL